MGNHKKKLELVHQFLVDEQYWLAVEPPDPDANAAYLGAVKQWAERHDKLKQRGFYVDVSKSGQTMTPVQINDEPSLRNVVEHVHQIGWQLRLAEHIEAKSQAESATPILPRRRPRSNKRGSCTSTLASTRKRSTIYWQRSEKGVPAGSSTTTPTACIYPDPRPIPSRTSASPDTRPRPASYCASPATPGTRT